MLKEIVNNGMAILAALVIVICLSFFFAAKISDLIEKLKKRKGS